MKLSDTHKRILLALDETEARTVAEVARSLKMLQGTVSARLCELADAGRATRTATKRGVGWLRVPREIPASST